MIQRDLEDGKNLEIFRAEMLRRKAQQDDQPIGFLPTVAILAFGIIISVGIVLALADFVLGWDLPELLG